MSTYLGWTVVSMPTSPPAPASLEFAHNAIAGANTNPFTAQQQVYDWQANWKEASVSMASMTAAQGALWAAFIESCDGVANVFQFLSGVCALFPNELTTDGTTPRYWRLKVNKVQWTIKGGKIYGLTFEIREAK
ncbi:MAG: hypothetical protein ABSH44_17795 [Bryobacteraceae bacterium]